jgi:hypothetical protein
MIGSSERCSYFLGLSLFVIDSCLSDQLDNLICSEAYTGYLSRIASVYIEDVKT